MKVQLILVHSELLIQHPSKACFGWIPVYIWIMGFLLSSSKKQTNRKQTRHLRYFFYLVQFYWALVPSEAKVAIYPKLHQSAPGISVLLININNLIKISKCILNGDIKLILI